MLKSDVHIFTGMQRDMSISKQKPEFLWDAHNIRLTAREGDTMLSVTSEKGTKQISGVSFTGTYLGHCVLNNYLVVFTTTTGTSGLGTDYIYRVNKNNNYSIDILYQGNLNFDPNYAIETLGVFENELIQKVYWVDGQNQPRLINIVKEQLDQSNVASVRSSYNSTSFDFVRTLALNEKINVTRLSSSGSQFQSGVIQYAMTYFDKYGQESNIAYTTPLHYIAHNERGSNPEEKVGVAFRVGITGLDTNFDYARIYSIYRSSLNGTPIVKRLTDIPITNNTTVTGGNIPNNSAVYYRATGTITISAGSSVSNLTYRDRYIGAFTPTETRDQWPSSEKFYHFTKADYPFFEIHVDNKIITWGGNTEFWISYNSNISGPSGGGRLIDGGLGSTNYFYIGTSITYGNAITGAFYVDNGTGGDVIDPTELLYVGGESVIASTITQKDGTLFLGNLKIIRPPVHNMGTVSQGTVSQGTRAVTLSGNNSSTYYNYLSLLTAKDNNGYSVNTAGFKWGEYYRFGVQLQYQNGKWSDPIWLQDLQITQKPTISGSTLNIPKVTIPVDLRDVPTGYLRARGVVVFPTITDRTIIAQGVLNPTVFNLQARVNGIPYAQSSWFFRPTASSLTNTTNDSVSSGAVVEFRHGYLLASHGDRGAEIQGVPEFDTGNLYGFANLSASTDVTFKRVINEDSYPAPSVKAEDATNIFGVDRQILTFHSPDIEFDDAIDALNLSGLDLYTVGTVAFTADMGDISIQTSSPTVHPDGAGFIHRSLKTTDGTRGLIAGLYYADYLVDDAGDIQAYDRQQFDFMFMVYPWQKTGSLNNDIVRPANKGARSSILSHKKMSNLRFASSTSLGTASKLTTTDVQLFSSDQVSMLKLGANHSYYGNVDTMLSPTHSFSVVFSNGDYHHANPGIDDTNSLGVWKARPSFTANKNTFLFMTKDSSGEGNMWHRRYNNGRETYYTRTGDSSHIGDAQGALAASKEAIRMKYKSTKHAVVELSSSLSTGNNGLYVAELRRDYSADTMFGGNTDEAKRSNTWLPAGEPVTISRSGNTSIEFIYGDTWYQRYDCLKTYPFTLEDENSITEIGSFLLETRMNIDGRYDRNRGQASNLVTTPQNFNLFNPVYTQPNNFFSYRILDSDYYKLDSYQGSVTWSLNKQAAATTDNWARVSLANLLDFDGNMGAITALVTVNDDIYCFQESGISRILFNSRVQIPTSDGIPVEISNNYKVEGNKYLSDTIGVKNKWNIVKSNSGLYFVDSTGSALYNLSNGLTDVSGTHGFSHWFDQLDTTTPWTPNNHTLKLFYDRNRTDLYVSTFDNCLCFSEVLGQFTSFMSYENLPAMFNIGSDFYTIKNGQLWQLFEGEYNKFFDYYQPFSITFISNAESSLDKIFTNLELRADFYKGEGYYAHTSQYTGDTTMIYQPPILRDNAFFNYILAENEYQYGRMTLSQATARPANLKKKFRIWRVDVPREGLNRMRNTWCKITLGMDDTTSLEDNGKMELHDVVVKYFT